MWWFRGGSGQQLLQQHGRLWWLRGSDAAVPHLQQQCDQIVRSECLRVLCRGREVLHDGESLAPDWGRPRAQKERGQQLHEPTAHDVVPRVGQQREVLQQREPEVNLAFRTFQKGGCDVHGARAGARE